MAYRSWSEEEEDVEEEPAYSLKLKLRDDGKIGMSGFAKMPLSSTQPGVKEFTGSAFLSLSGAPPKLDSPESYLQLERRAAKEILDSPDFICRVWRQRGQHAHGFLDSLRAGAVPIQLGRSFLLHNPNGFMLISCSAEGVARLRARATLPPKETDDELQEFGAAVGVKELQAWIAEPDSSEASAAVADSLQVLLPGQEECDKLEAKLKSSAYLSLNSACSGVDPACLDSCVGDFLVVLCGLSYGTDLDINFPGGRRLPAEESLSCALRRLSSEVRIPASSIRLALHYGKLRSHAGDGRAEGSAFFYAVEAEDADSFEGEYADAPGGGGIAAAAFGQG